MNNNKLIAEFMGHKPHSVMGCGKVYYNYSKFWDLLMPVVEKIENGGLDPHELIDKALESRVIEDVYNEVVDTIKRHNNESYFLCGSCGERCSEYTYSEDRDVDECNDCKTSNDER